MATGEDNNFWEAEIDGEKASVVAKNKALDEAIRVEIAAIKAEEERAKGVEGQLTEIVEGINDEVAANKGKVMVAEGGELGYLSEKLVSGSADEANNTYAVTATAAEDKISLTE